jgi:hypothetical protein
MLVIQYPCIITLQNNLDERLNESVTFNAEQIAKNV